MCSYPVCGGDHQVKLVQSLIAVQSGAGAKLARLLVYGEEARRCAASASARAQAVANGSKRPTILICG